MTASSNISPAFTKKKSRKNKDNFVKIKFEVHNYDSICVAGPSSTDKPKQLKQRPWWTTSTKLAKNRKSLWYSIWKSCDKPRAGYVYICYKLAKTKYRQACRTSFNTRNANSFRTLNTLYRT